jgi:general secretion pathway protein N
MRVRLPVGRSLFFLAAFLVALAALLPLRLAAGWLGLGERGLAAREVRGSVWLGRMSEAQWGQLPLGDLEARLRALPLLAGRARVDVSSRGSPERVDGGLTVTRHSVGLDDMTAQLEGAALFAPLPVTALNLSDVSARFANGACVTADGRVTASIAAIPGLPASGSLSGSARCDAAALLLPLQGGSGLERIELRLFGDGRYSARIAIPAPSVSEAGAALLSAGFVATNGGYVLEQQGRF